VRVSDPGTQDTEMSEPPTNQEDFFVWIKNLESRVECTEQFYRGLLNACTAEPNQVYCNRDDKYCCDLNDIRGNESLYCFEACGSVLACED